MSNFKYKYLKYKLKLKDLEQEGGENEYHAGVKNDEEEYHSTSSEEVIPTPVQEGGNDTITFPEYLEIETEQEGGENEYFPSDSESEDELFHFEGGALSKSAPRRMAEPLPIDAIKFTGTIDPKSIIGKSMKLRRDADLAALAANGNEKDEVFYIRVKDMAEPVAYIQRGTRNILGMSTRVPTSGNTIIRIELNPGNNKENQILKITTNFDAIHLKLKKIKVYRGDLLKKLSNNFTDLTNLRYIDNDMPVIPQVNTSNMGPNTTTVPESVMIDNSQFEQPQVSSNMGPNTTTFSQNDEKNCRDDPGQFRNCIHKIDYCIERNFGSNLEECDVNWVIEKLDLLDKDNTFRIDHSAYLELLKQIDKKLSFIPDSNLKKEDLRYRLQKHNNIYSNIMNSTYNRFSRLDDALQKNKKIM